VARAASRLLRRYEPASALGACPGSIPAGSPKGRGGDGSERSEYGTRAPDVAAKGAGAAALDSTKMEASKSKRKRLGLRCG